MDKEKLMARLAALPTHDFLHAGKLSDPLGSNTSYRASTVAQLIEQAVAAERERCALVCERLADHYSADEGAHVADHCALDIRA